jgi:hypothetical protein
MSAVDAIFVFFYVCCGIFLGAFLARHVGPIYGIVGFLIGFAAPMALWRFLARHIGTKRTKTSDGATGTLDHGDKKT